MKPSEIEMANFLESLKAPQGRRIMESLLKKPLTEAQLVKMSRLSKKSIVLHLLPLIEAKLVLVRKNETGIHYSINEKIFIRNANWFAQFL